MQKRTRNLNIHKKDARPFLTSEAAWVLHAGCLLILAALLRLLYDILRAAPFPPATAERFGTMLEYPVAALALLTALAFLVDRAVRAEQKNR